MAKAASSFEATVLDCVAMSGGTTPRSLQDNPPTIFGSAGILIMYA